MSSKCLEVATGIQLRTIMVDEKGRNQRKRTENVMVDYADQMREPDNLPRVNPKVNGVRRRRRRRILFTRYKIE